MWNKTERETFLPEGDRPRDESVADLDKRPRPAVIGKSLVVSGDITGDADLVIEGRLEGSVRLEHHQVVVRSTARVTADIYGKKIAVDGEVKGNLFGDEVVIGRLGKVEGNATARKVTLENGSNFRGKIDMHGGRPSAPPN